MTLKLDVLFLFIHQIWIDSAQKITLIRGSFLSKAWCCFLSILYIDCCMRIQNQTSFRDSQSEYIFQFDDNIQLPVWISASEFLTRFPSTVLLLQSNRFPIGEPWTAMIRYLRSWIGIYWAPHRFSFICKLFVNQRHNQVSFLFFKFQIKA